MSKSPEWKERREKYISERRRNAKQRLEQAGFSAVRFRTFTFGLCRMFVGER